MAKITDISFDINGVPYKINVNCTSSGQFTAKLPKHVAEALRMDETLTAHTLTGLTSTFESSLKHYKTLQTTETLHILVSYHARGKYTYKKDGSVLFGQSERRYQIDISFSEISDAVGFDFMVAIKQVIDGKERWFRAYLGSDFPAFKEESYEPEKYHKSSPIYPSRLERYKILPYSATALQTLETAQEKMRVLSESLFNFINQDEEVMFLTLNNQKLLE